jgi:hypothetical protein
VCNERVSVLPILIAQNPCKSRVLGISKNFAKKQKNLKKVLAFFIHRLYIIRACLRQGRGLTMPETAENTAFSPLSGHAKTQEVAALSGNFCRELSAL